MKKNETIKLIPKMIENEKYIDPVFFKGFAENIPKDKTSSLKKVFNYLSEEEKSKLIKSQSLDVFLKKYPEIFQTCGQPFRKRGEKKKIIGVRLANNFDSKKEYFGPEYKPKLVPDIKQLEFIYSVDFELAYSIEEDFFPVEIGCVKINAKTGEIVEKFHAFINPLAFSYLGKYSEKHIHGLPFRKMQKLTSESLKTIMNNFLNFIDYDHSIPILFAKNTLTEIKTFDWISRRLNWNLNLHIFELYEVVGMYDLDMQIDHLCHVEHQAARFVEHDDKCEHHRSINEKFHCALDDVIANAKLIKSGIDNGFEHFLKLEKISRNDNKKRKNMDEVQENSTEKKSKLSSENQSI
eukprot:gene4590-7973_t